MDQELQIDTSILTGIYLGLGALGDRAPGKEQHAMDFVEAYITRSLHDPKKPKSLQIDKDIAHKVIGSGECGNRIITVEGRGGLAKQAPLIFATHVDTESFVSPRMDDGSKLIRGGGADSAAGITTLLYTAYHINKQLAFFRPFQLVFTVQGTKGADALDPFPLQGNAEGVVWVSGPTPAHILDRSIVTSSFAPHRYKETLYLGLSKAECRFRTKMEIIHRLHNITPQFFDREWATRSGQFLLQPSPSTPAIAIGCGIHRSTFGQPGRAGVEQIAASIDGMALASQILMRLLTMAQ